MDTERFLSKEWQDKRTAILARDNYSCLNCKTFNPSLGMVTIYKPDDKTVELHEYESSPFNSKYRVSSERTGITVQMDFGINWLVLPVMQVHHTRYIENKQIWEYDDSFLITLCKECHTLFHDTIEIPVFDSNGNFLHKKKFAPEVNDFGFNHDYKPWTFKTMDFSTKEYKVSEVIEHSVGFFVFAEEDDDEKAKVAESMVKDFFERYLPDYSNKFDTIQH